MIVKNKKIALIYKKISKYGGQEKFIYNFYGYLINNGWNVKIIAMKKDAEIMNHNVQLIRILPWPNWLKTLNFAIFSYIYGKTLEKKGYITFGFGKTFGTNIYRAGGGVHKKYVKQSLLRFRNPISKMYHKVKRFLSLYHHIVLTIENLNFKYKQSKIYIAPSKMVKKDIIDCFGVDENKIKVVYNEVDQTIFNITNRKNSKNNLMKTFNIKNGFYFLFVSTNHLLKGLDYLLDAFKIAQDFMEDTYLFVVGNGYNEYFIKKTNKLNINNVVFVGKSNNVSMFYKGCDVLVYPSLFDASSNVVMEALSCGLPALVSRYAGYYELVELSKAGDIIENPTDIHEIKIKMIEFYRKKGILEELSRYAHEFIQQMNYNQFKVLEKYIMEIV